MSMLIRLSDVIDSKVQKEKEFEFYQRELQKPNQKMVILREQITVTNIIIDLVRSEKVRDFKKEFEQKQKNPSGQGGDGWGCEFNNITREEYDVRVLL